MAGKKRQPFGGQAKRTSIKREINKSLNELGISFKHGLLYIGLPFISALLFGLFITWGEPNFPGGVLDWRDSGFMHKHGEYNVFYQDIYQMKVNRSGPVLLILHGFPTSSYDWKKVMFQLTGHFSEIIAVDMLGLGFSDKPPNHNYTVLEQAIIHENILKANKVDQVHLLAHDLGDTVAQEMLSRYMERDANNDHSLRILSLCLSNGGILPETHRPRFMQKLLRIPYIGPVVAMFMNHLTFKVSFSEVFGARTKPSGQDLWDFWTIVRHKNGHFSIQRVLNYIDERYRNRDRWVGALQETKIPLHYIYGTLDPVNKGDSLERYRMLMPHSTVTVLEDIGHYPQWEDPDGFLKGYREFLNRIGVKRK
eukprot:gene5972-6668_t